MTEEARMLDAKTNEVMGGGAGMGEGTDGHTTATIGADGIPVVEAGNGINLPLKSAIDAGAVLMGDGLAGAVLGATFALLAEFEDGVIGGVGIGGKGEIGGDDAETDTGTFLGSDEEAVAADFAKTGIAGDERSDDLVVAVDVGTGLIAKVADEGGELNGDASSFDILMGGFESAGAGGGGGNETLVHFYGEGDGMGVVLMKVDGIAIGADASTDVGVDMVRLEGSDAGGEGAIMMGVVFDDGGGLLRGEGEVDVGVVAIGGLTEVFG